MKTSSMEQAARKVAARLREQGHVAYFAGGCVRDMVRRLAPKDYDIATDARPETVQALFPRTVRSRRAFRRDHGLGGRLSIRGSHVPFR